MLKAFIMVMAAGGAILGALVMVSGDILTGAAICSTACAVTVGMLHREGIF